VNKTVQGKPTARIDLQDGRRHGPALEDGHRRPRGTHTAAGHARVWRTTVPLLKTAQGTAWIDLKNLAQSNLARSITIDLAMEMSGSRKSRPWQTALGWVESMICHYASVCGNGLAPTKAWNKARVGVMGDRNGECLYRGRGFHAPARHYNWR